MGACCSKPEAKEISSDNSSEQEAPPPKARSVPLGTVGSSLMHLNDSAKSLPANADKVDYDYEVIKLLGKGAGGETYLCRSNQTNENLAIKFIKRPIPVVSSQTLAREVNIQAQLGEGHLNIVKAVETVLTDNHLGLVMEYVAGGNLTQYVMSRFDSVDDRGGLCLEEDEARYFFRQIISVLEYCHRHRVAHRDLKLDNTLLTDQQPPVIKICDFGFARAWAEDPSMTTITGTPDYMAPQLTGSKKGNKSKYDGSKADIWAAGVLLCVMLVGKFPYDGNQLSRQGISETMRVVFQQQKSVRHWHAAPNLAEDAALLTPLCRDLLDQLLMFDESQRITIEGIKDHPWVTAPLPEPYQTSLDTLFEQQRVMDDNAERGLQTSVSREAAVKKLVTAAASMRSGMCTPASKLKKFKVERRVSLQGGFDEDLGCLVEGNERGTPRRTPPLSPLPTISFEVDKGANPDPSRGLSREISLKLEQVALKLQRHEGTDGSEGSSNTGHDSASSSSSALPSPAAAGTGPLSARKSSDLASRGDQDAIGTLPSLRPPPLRRETPTLHLKLGRALSVKRAPSLKHNSSSLAAVVEATDPPSAVLGEEGGDAAKDGGAAVLAAAVAAADAKDGGGISPVTSHMLAGSLNVSQHGPDPGEGGSSLAALGQAAEAGTVGRVAG